VSESCHTCDWVMSHMWVSHVTHVSESCHTCEWVMSHMWVTHVTHVSDSCETSEAHLRCDMSHIWVSHVTHLAESCHTSEAHLRCNLSHIWVTHAHTSVAIFHICVCTCHFTNVYVQSISHISYVKLTYMPNNLYLCLTQLIHYPHIRATWLFHICQRTCTYVQE